MSSIEQIRLENRETVEKEEMDWQDRVARDKRASTRTQELFDRQIAPYLRRATVADYRKWLEGYLAGGGSVSNHYDYPVPDNFYVACADFKMLPLYGATSFRVIVPATVTVSGDQLGHCVLFFMDGFRTSGAVPFYSDI